MVQLPSTFPVAFGEAYKLVLESWPLPPKYTVVSQKFGEHPEWYVPYGLAGHEGWDFPCPVETPTFATHDGWIDPKWRDEYGNSVRVYGEGFVTFHAHLIRTVGAYGQIVRAGQEIGKTGSTGRSTGPHLHWGIQVDGVPNPKFKGWLDPKDYLLGGNMHSKLFYQFQKSDRTQWAIDHVRMSGVNIRKQLQPDYCSENYYPWLDYYLDRYVFDRDADKALIEQGVRGAEEYVRNWLEPRARNCKTPREKTIIEGPNEPGVETPEQLRNLVAFEKRRIQLIHDLGFLAATFSMGTGRGGVTQEAVKAFWRIMGPAIAEADLLVTHEYGMRAMTPLGWPHLGRSKLALDALWEAGIRLFLVVSETGIDLAGNGQTDGWRMHTSGIADFISNHLAPYDDFIGPDPRIMGACPFIWLADSKWPSFDLREPDSLVFSQYVQGKGAFKGSLGTLQPPVPPEPALPPDEEIRNLAWNAVGVAYNSTHAFPKYARERGLGAPLGGTFDYKGIRVQPFMGGIVKCILALIPDNTDWSNTTHIKW